MKKSKFIFLLLFCFVFENCATSKWKKELVSEGNTVNAINNAITDFFNTSKLSKKDTVFSLKVTDAGNGILVIGIIGAVNKIYPTDKNKVGAFDEFFPTRYIIRDEKLFYWNDTTQVITQEMISTLERFDQIDFNWSKEYILPPLIIDDGKEGMVYYFCENDLRNYKKNGSGTIRQHYDPPKLNCKKKSKKKN